MLKIVLATLFVVGVAGQCSFENEDISARWQVVNNELTVQFINKNIGNNQWTAIAFGENMSDLEVVLFAVENNKASIRTGYTSGYGPPKLDSTVSVVPERVMYNSNQLTTRFTRPLGVSGPRGSNLTQCMTWNFVSNGNYEDGDVGYHRSSPIGVEFVNTSQMINGQFAKHSRRPFSMRVCPGQCTQLFDQRNVLSDPLPQAAIYNNRQSSRYDGLHGSY